MCEEHEEQEQVEDDIIAARREAMMKYAGAFTGVYGENYLAELRADWPE